MSDTFLKYLFEVAPVVAVLGGWVYSLIREKGSLVKDVRAKDAQLSKEIAENRERDKENLKAIMETSSVLEALTKALQTSENNFVHQLTTRTEEVKTHITSIGDDIKRRIASDNPKGDSDDG